MMQNKKIKVLWVSPNLVHYKINNLNHLQKNTNIDIITISGVRGTKILNTKHNIKLQFKNIKTNVVYKKFGLSKIIRNLVKNHIAGNDWLLIPLEKKFIPLLVYSYFLKLRLKNVHRFKIFSYNHDITTQPKSILFWKIVGRFIFYMYDKIIYYSEEGLNRMIEYDLISKPKADFINNTINTKEISKIYKFEYPDRNDISILYIGRLYKQKDLPTLIYYFKILKNKMNDIGKNLTLTIIGSGPLKDYIVNTTNEIEDIKFIGPLSNEIDIMPHMKNANLVFIPGVSGLTINHAFSYGRPFATILNNNSHGPELSFLSDDVNGFILSEDEEKNINRLFDFLRKPSKRFYKSAYERGQELSIDNWGSKFEKILNEY